MNAEFQRIARRDKKTFLNDHCKEIEERNKVGLLLILVDKVREMVLEWASPF